MAAKRRLSPEEESALIRWYAQYQQARLYVQCVGTVRQKAKEMGVTTQLIHLVVKRPKYELRRKLKAAQSIIDSSQ